MVCFPPVRGSRLQHPTCSHACLPAPTQHYSHLYEHSTAYNAAAAIDNATSSPASIVLPMQHNQCPRRSFNACILVRSQNYRSASSKTMAKFRRPLSSRPRETCIPVIRPRSRLPARPWNCEQQSWMLTSKRTRTRFTLQQCEWVSPSHLKICHFFPPAALSLTRPGILRVTVTLRRNTPPTNSYRYSRPCEGGPVDTQAWHPTT